MPIPEIHIYHKEILPIEQDIKVESSYWQEKIDPFPSETHNRVGRLQLFRNLYDGKHNGILPAKSGNYALKVNFFKDLSEFIAMILMAYPPEADVANPDNLRKLHVALEDALVNYTRYGTSIMSYYLNENGFGINNLDPRYFFPTYSGYVYLEFGDNLTVHYWEDNTYSYRTFSYEKSLGTSTSIGTQIDSGTVGEYASLPIAICSRGERDGIWGQSLYYDIYQENVEITRRLSGMSESFDYFERPRLHYLYGREQDIPRELNTIAEQQAEMAQHFVNIDNGKEIHTTAHRVEYTVPEKFTDTVSPQLDRVYAQLFKSANVPQTLYGMYKGDAQAKTTGSTVRETRISTKFMCRQIMNKFTPCINDILRAAGESVEINWIEALDVQEPNVQEPDNNNEDDNNE